MTISASLVKELREKTGVGLMECKKALQESNADIDEAVKILREKGIAKAAKKADRSTNEGRIFIASADDNKSAAIIELTCETDFVASNDDFSVLGNQIAQATVNSEATTAEDTLALSLDGKDVQGTISDYVLKLGENIQVRKVNRVAAQGSVSQYVHSNGKIGVLVAFADDVAAETGADIAMHVAAANPQYVNSSEVPSDEIEKEKDIIRVQAKNEGRPDAVVDKIVEGKINKYYKEVCLVEQPFVKDDKKAVKDILPSASSIESFTRYSLV